jgi:phosphoglycerate dehydrogenase-like enzyme
MARNEHRDRRGRAFAMPTTVAQPQLDVITTADTSGGHLESATMTNLLILLTLPEFVRNQYRDQLKAKFPQLSVNVVDHRSKVGPHIASTDVLLTFPPMLSDEVIRDAVQLKWVQALGTGLDNLIDLPSLRDDVLITNMHGIHGPPVSEAALAAMLALARDLPRAVRAQDQHEWVRWPARLIDRKTVGIIGVGVIAEALAPKCKALGMHVVGISSVKREVAGFDEMRSRDDLAAAVADLDFLILLTPLTPQTRGIVNTRVLAAMKPTSFLVNLARGGVVDEAALVAALQREQIAGAALDVFAQEPLPAEHPFWAMPNVIITTHQGGFCDVYPDLVMPILENNMRQFLAGNVAGMINVIQR